MGFVVAAKDIGERGACGRLMDYRSVLQPPRFEGTLGLLKVIRAKANALELAGGPVETGAIVGGAVAALPEEPLPELELPLGVSRHDAFPDIGDWDRLSCELALTP